MITIIQGDSYGQDITSVDVASGFDANWSGKWALVKTIGALATITGDLTKSVDTKVFYLRILPIQTENLAEGKYFLIVQIENSATNFKKEIQQVAFSVTKQGIPG